MSNIMRIIILKTAKIVFCLVLLVSTNHSFSQPTRFSSFISSYKGVSHDLRIGGNSGGYIIYLQLMSYDKFNELGNIILYRKQHLEFITCLTEVKKKYEEWVERTKQINQKESRETFKMPFKTHISFWSGKRWWRTKEINLIWSFYTISKGDQQNPEYLLSVATGVLHPPNNTFVTHTGFGLVFNSATEIQTLLDELTVGKIQVALQTHLSVH